MTHDPMLELASCILNKPTLFNKAWMDALLAIRAGNSDAEAFFDFLFSDKPSSEYANLDGVAVIDVKGPLMKESRYMTSYAGITSQLDKALGDPGVRSVLLNIDSGGGVVSGAFELGSHIFESRRVKPIHAIANDDAYSAAFAIGSAASSLTVTPSTGGVGSVGVIATHVEYSKEESSLGWTYTTIYSGDRKNDFSSHEPLKKEAKSELQGYVDSLRDTFASSVSRNRNISFAHVMGTEAAVYRDAEAVKVGFADRVGDFDSAFQIASEAGGSDGSTVAVAASIGSTTEESNMDTTTTTSVAATATAANQADNVIDIESVRTEARNESRSANNEIIELCAIARQPNMAIEFITNGTSVSDVRKALLDSRADGAADEINSVEPQHANMREHDEKALVNEMARRLKAAGVTPEVR